MTKEGLVPETAQMTIRVFYPNPIKGLNVVGTESDRLDCISKIFKVKYLYKNDPLYHELVFIDENGIRHQIIGLAYHLEEKLPHSGGIDAEA